MKVLDANATIESLQLLIQQVQDQQEQLGPVEGWLQHETTFLNVEAKFNGRTAINIINYFTYCHGPFVKLLRTVLSEFENTLQDTLDKLNTYFESDELIREDFLQDGVHGKIENLKATMVSLGEEVNSITSMYKDIVYLPTFNYNGVMDGLSNSKAKVDSTIEKIHEFDEEQITSMQYVGQDITLLQNYVTSLEEMFVSQSISIENFSKSMMKDNDDFREVKNTQNVREADQVFSFVGDSSTLFGYGDSAFFAGQNVLAATSIGIGTYADMTKNGKAPLPTSQSAPTSTPSKNNSFLDKTKQVAASAKNKAGVALHNAMASERAQNFARTFSKYEIEKHAAKFVDNKYTRAAGPVGWGLTIVGNFSEFTNSDNRDKTGLEKTARFASGTLVEAGGAAGGAAVGAKAGAALGTLIAPGIGTVAGGLIGGAIGGLGGAYAGSKLSENVKDLAESGTKKVVEVGTNIKNKVTNSVSSWFK
ncbi:LXG domain-containing protein [Alkalihalophilus lindianensis]|uniref:LXG domain-containing protein n=1 Tax=Alkalihalophilus lindianensis TaxID=1630542 RepID=A0ABU3X505_9BACI|nr:LXG domain-containing protein [Alkalihalophilus lindianensis]MDV2682973.1 LXG domain-containing protein [Alkalihalophilus lindianensis]